MRKTFALTALIATASPALAQSASPTPPDPTVAALAQMAQECAGREMSALARAYALAAENKRLKDDLAATTKRAEDAEVKLAKER